MKSNVKILRMNPNIFITWIFIISISMIFVSLISAYIVKKGEPGGLIINLPNGGTIIVDSKAPLKSYLEANEANDQDMIKDLLSQHSKSTRKFMRSLSQKSYW